MSTLLLLDHHYYKLLPNTESSSYPHLDTFKSWEIAPDCVCANEICPCDDKGKVTSFPFCQRLLMLANFKIVIYTYTYTYIYEHLVWFSILKLL